jgi:hypothetical protein
VLELLQRVAIEAEHAIACSKPHEPFPVLQHRRHAGNKIVAKHVVQVLDVHRLLRMKMLCEKMAEQYSANHQEVPIERRVATREKC